MNIREEAKRTLSFLADKEKIQFGTGCYMSGANCQAVHALVKALEKIEVDIYENGERIAEAALEAWRKANE